MFESLMDRTDVRLERETLTKDAAAGNTRTWATVIPAGFACSIQSASTGEVFDWSRRQVQCDTVIYSLTDFDTILGSRLGIGDRFVDGDGIIYSVTGVRKDKNTRLNAAALYDIAALDIRNHP